jgi:hypothetical protein
VGMGSKTTTVDTDHLHYRIVECLEGIKDAGEDLGMHKKHTLDECHNSKRIETSRRHDTINDMVSKQN